jgi:hypothetical protein
VTPGLQVWDTVFTLSKARQSLPLIRAQGGIRTQPHLEVTSASGDGTNSWLEVA